MEVKVYPKKVHTYVPNSIVIDSSYYIEPDLDASPRLGVVQKYFIDGAVIAFDDGTLDAVSYKLIRHNLGE